MSNEKFISLDNLRQYDEFLDEELNKIKDTVDKEFTFNVKYAESDEIGGAAIKAVNDETGENIAKHFSDVESAIAINKTTLGYQRKNLLPYPSYTKWIGSRTFTWDSEGYMTSADANTTEDNRLWKHGNANRSIYLEAGTYTYSVHVKTAPTTGHNFVYIVDESDTPIVQISSVVNGERTFTLTESKTLYLIEKVNNGSVAFMIRSADITDDTYEPYVDDVDTRITENKSNITINKTTLGYQKKNLLNNANVTKTAGGVTFTVNSDKSVSLSGTSTSQVFLYFDFDEQLINNQKVILSGCPSGGNSNTYALAVRYYNESGAERYAFDTGSEITVTPADMMQIILVIRAGVNTDGLTFYPMLRYADVIDDTYEPYVDDVDTRITDNKNDIAINKTTLGYQKKNLLKNNASTRAVNGITFTVNNDKSVTLNGTATAQADFFLRGTWDGSDLILPKGNYIASIGVEQDDSFTGCALNIVNGTNVFASQTSVYPSQVLKNVSITGVYIAVNSGRTFNNYTLYPMIRSIDVADDTYEPYIDDIDTRIIENKSDIKINETTLGYTKKNLLKPLHPAGTTGGWGGKTYKFNSDGSFTVNGTATGELAFCFSKVYLTKGTYILSSTAGFDLQLFLDGNYVSGAYVNNDTELVIATDGTYEFKWWHGSGTSISTTIYPMLRYPDVIDSTFEPYVESVNERLQNFVKSGSEAKAGLVPAPSTTAGTTKYLREDGTWQVPPNTNTVGKTIDGNYKTSFRTQTKGNSTAGDYLSNIRNDTASVSGSPQFGSGLAFGRADTHGYLYTSYSDAEAYIGGGNADNLKWVSKISLDGHTHNYLPLSGGTMNKDAIIKMPITHDGRYSEFTGGSIKNVVSTGGWAMGIGYYQVDGSTLMADIGVYGSGNTLNYYYMGPAFDNPLFTLDNSGNANFKGSVSATSFNGYTLGSMSTKNNLSTKIYSSTNSSGITTITIDNLFNKYSMIFINAISDSGGVHTYLIPLQILKSKVNLGYSDSSNFNVQYIDDSSFRIFEYMVSGAEKYTTVEVYAIY